MEKTAPKDTTILALIITYNPDLSLLRKNILALQKQVQRILIMDNASENIAEIREEIAAESDIQLIANQENLGLPANYNRAAALAEREGYQWLLIMDQDTIVPKDLISSYLQCVRDMNPAIVTPVFWDDNQKTYQEPLKRIPDEPYTPVERCMGSASMNRVDVIRSTGGFDEKLFIDYADYEFCRGVISRGYSIIRVNRCTVNHRLGQAREVRFLWIPLTLRNYPPIRYYYIIRNLVYLARKHASFREYLYAISILLKAMIKVSYEEKTKEKRKMLLQGFRDGRKL